MRNQANMFLLRACLWSVFGTLTFKAEKSEEGVTRAGLSWLDAVRLKLSVPESEFYWILRPERGEAGGRLHLHVLLRVRPCFLSLFWIGPCKVSWAVRSWRHGLSRFRLVDGLQDSSLEYIVKPESGIGADAYEGTKTQGCARLLASNAVVNRGRRQKCEGWRMDGQAEPCKATGHTDRLSVRVR